ncbi:zinc-dependent alcohol dehydrogenase [Williamsia soli]|uniref:zinc-dependent alcohol dehydrogenase n=1 Tax=Williamsia soli TaxID=364929 RepID=UPI001A9E1D88|nr:alcohol dehydrogenase catalytic domain-containing protein [Williamsia soli]
MRAAVLDNGKFTVREVPDPQPGPDELILRVHGCGVCGSDLKTYPLLPDGTIMGHEFAGEVVAAGPDVAGLWPIGTPAAALPVIGCRRCRRCAEGDPARCVTPQPLGLGVRSGGFAEYVAVAASETVALEPSIDLRTGALVEPLAVGLHALNRGRARIGDRVLVIEAGPVGLSVVVWARHRGIADITVVDPVSGRRDSATALGASRVIDPTTTPLGTDFDVVIECVGKSGMVAACVDAIAAGGHVVIAGVCMTEDTFMPVGAVVKDITMSFVSYYSRDEFAITARALGAGELRLDGYVSAFAALEDLQEVAENLGRPTDQQKIIITPLTRSTP